jgi:hypothetical protein
VELADEPATSDIGNVGVVGNRFMNLANLASENPVSYEGEHTFMLIAVHPDVAAVHRAV